MDYDSRFLKLLYEKNMRTILHSLISFLVD